MVAQRLECIDHLRPAQLIFMHRAVVFEAHIAFRGRQKIFTPPDFRVSSLAIPTVPVRHRQRDAQGYDRGIDTGSGIRQLRPLIAVSNVEIGPSRTVSCSPAAALASSRDARASLMISARCASDCSTPKGRPVGLSKVSGSVSCNAAISVRPMAFSRSVEGALGFDRRDRFAEMLTAPVPGGRAADPAPRSLPHSVAWRCSRRPFENCPP